MTALTYTDSTNIKQEAHWPFLLCHFEAVIEDHGTWEWILSPATSAEY